MSVIVGEVKISEKFEKNHSQFSGKYKTCLLDVVNDFPKPVLKITIKANPHVVANLDLRKLDKACVVTDSLSARFSNGTNVFIKKCRGARHIKELIDKATELPRLPRANQSEKSQIICKPNNVDFIEIGRERTKIPIRNQPPVSLDEKQERKISASTQKAHAVHGGIGGVLEENNPLFTQVKKRRSSEGSHSGKETPVKLVSSMGNLSSKKHISPSDKKIKPPLSQITNQSNNVDSTQIGDDLQSGLVKTHETELTDDAQERRISTSTPKPKTFGRGKHESSDESDDNLPLFTYMKKRRVSTGESHTDGNTETTWGNESHKVKGDSSAKETTPNKFLDKAEQKSRLCENSSGLSSKSFYNTETSDRLHGSFGLSTSKIFTKKRPERKLFAFEPTKSVNYSWTPKSSTVVNSKSTLTGFSNLGNTCYMNAILQSLFSLDSFADDLTFLQNQTRRLEHCQKSLFFLLANLWESKKKKMSDERQNKCLTEVKQAISVTAKRFSGKEQHDAHEFLSQVIDQVKEETQKQNEKVAEMDNKKRTNNNDERSPENKKKHDIMKDRYLNPAILNFEFEVLHKITCLKCLSDVKKIEIFHDLSIDMPKRMNCNDKSTLQDALDQFFQREKIDYTCEKCQHKQVEVSHTFYRAPRVIILQLKRYRFNSATTQNKKLVRGIGIPRFLTLSDHCTQETGPPYFLDMKDFYRVERDALTSTENMSVTPESKTRRTYTFKKPPSSVFAVDSKSSSTPKSTFKNRIEQEDEDLARALEESRSEKKQTDIRMYTSGMSEETQLKIAMELSLHDNEQNDTASRTPNSRRSLGKSEPRSRSPKACSKRLKLEGQEDGIAIISEGENRSAEISTGGEKEVTDRRDGGMFVEEMSMFTDSEPEDEKTGGNINEVKERKIECENDGLKQCKDLPEESCIETQKQSTNKSPDGEIIGKNMKKHRTHTEYMTLSSDSDSEKVPLPKVDGTVSGKNFKNEKKKYEEEDAKAPKQSPIMISSDPDWLIAKRKEEEDLDKAVKLSLKESQALQSSSLQEKEDGDLRRAIELSLKEVSDDKEQSWTFEESFLDEPIQRSSHTAEEIKTNLKVGNLPYSYRLVSIVSHLGSSEAGHYISDVYSAEKDHWFSYNDKDVSQMSEESVLQTRENSGYIFFYVNRDILDSLATERKNRETSSKENISQSEKKTKQPGLFSARRSAPTALSFMNSSSIL